MKKYTVKTEYADQIFGRECDTAYIEECMKNGMPESDVMHLVREWGEEALDMFEIEDAHWYAALRDAEDDWGTGSFNFSEAMETAQKFYESGEEEALVAEIDNGVCIKEFYVKDRRDTI